MNRQQIIGRLKDHEPELRKAGVLQLSLFGSVARGEDRSGSDVDVAVRLDPERRLDLFDFTEIANRLEQLLEAKVDLLCEPIEQPRLRARVDKDRALVF